MDRIHHHSRGHRRRTGPLQLAQRADGPTTPRGAPKNPLRLGATFWHFRHESRVTSPPIWIQNLMLPILAVLAKLLAVKPYYERWDSRVSE
jgi:hypothetical protein